MHVDEAVQAEKFKELYEEGRYRFDPREYHGPTLNYATLPVAWAATGAGRTFADTTEFTYRLVPVIFGVGTVLLLFLLADGLGWPATLLAAVLTAVSPALVFYNRYYIHESLLVFFTLGLIGAAWRYVRTRKLGWALLAGALLGLMHATKETFVLSGAAMAAAVVGAVVWRRCRTDPQVRRPLSGELLALLPPPRVLAAGAAVAAAVSIVLFSSFFTHWRGPLDSVLTYSTYLNRAGGQGLHDHPWHFYLGLLVYYKEEGGPVWTEGLIVLLALVGFVMALWGRGVCVAQAAGLRRDPEDCAAAALAEQRAGLARFLAFYTLILTAMYSYITYKTPWCMMSFLHGMILLGALGLALLVRSLPHLALKLLVCVLLLAGVSHLAYQAYRASLNPKFYADWRNPYVYAHTGTDIYNFAQRMEDLAQVHPDGYDMVVKVITRDYWPVPWYVRRFRNVGYWHEPPAGADAPVIITSPETEDALAGALRRQYVKGHYGLRPGVFLKLYVEKSLWDEFLKRRTPPRPGKAP